MYVLKIPQAKAPFTLSWFYWFGQVTGRRYTGINRDMLFIFNQLKGIYFLKDLKMSHK